MISTTNEDVRRLVEVFLTKGKKLRYSETELLINLLNVMNQNGLSERMIALYLERTLQGQTDNQKFNENSEKIYEMEEETYKRIAEKVLRSKQNKRRVPNGRPIKLALDILYFIHQKKYEDEKDFIFKLSKRLNVKEISIKNNLLGSTYHSLYSGIFTFLTIYLPYGKVTWKSSNLKDRLEFLERAEKGLYFDMLSEFEEEKAR